MLSWLYEHETKTPETRAVFNWGRVFVCAAHLGVGSAVLCTVHTGAAVVAVERDRTGHSYRALDATSFCRSARAICDTDIRYSGRHCRWGHVVRALEDTGRDHEDWRYSNASVNTARIAGYFAS